MFSLAGIVFAWTDDTNPNYIQGYITINGTRAPSGTNYTVNVTAGTNAGCLYNGTVNDSNVPITRRAIGTYATGDQVCFSTSDSFAVTILGFSQNITGVFATGGNGNLITYSGLVNLSASYPENLPPITTFNSSSTNVTSVNGWYNNTVNVTLFPNDYPLLVGSGLNATYYDNNGTGWLSGTNFIVSSEGNNTIIFYSVDNNGSVESNQTVYMNLDVTAPSVTIDAVTTPTNISTQFINGTFNETGSGIAAINVSGVIAILNGSSYSAAFTLVEGLNTIYVNSTDNASKVGTNSTSIILDTTAPHVTIDQVTSPTNVPLQTITGTFIENGTGIAGINVSGTAATLTGNNYSAAVPLVQGVNTIYVNATDNITNMGTNFTTIILDTGLPAISSITNSTPTSVSVTITWITNESATSLVKYGNLSGSLNLNSSNASFSVNHSIALSSLQTNTTYYYVVNSTDAAGNSNESAELSFTTAAAPTVIISSPTDITYNTTSISLNASFAGQNVSYAWYKLDDNANSTAQANTTTLNATLSVTPDGQHNVTVYANDSSGALGQSTRHFVVDTTAPIVTIDPVTSPTNATSQRINGTFIENNSGIETVIVNGITANLTGSNYSVLILLDEGFNTINVNATDNVSNTGRTNTTILRDTIAPIVTINTVISPTNTTAQTINGTFTETGSGIASIIVNGVTATISGTNYSAPSVPLGEGTNTIYVNATDNASNADSVNTTILLDTIAPLVTVNAVTSPTNSTTQTITGTFTESGSGIAAVIVNGVTATISGFNYSAASVPLAEGTNTLYVNATDNASNLGTNSSTTIVLDTTAPGVTINPVTSPVNATSQTITGSFSEAGSGIASVIVNGVTATLTGSNYSASSVPLNIEGTNTIYVNATDNASNVGRLNTTIIRDSTPPVISSIANSTPTSVSITITWTTDENATSLVKYNTSASGNLNLSSINATLTTSHSVTLADLLPNTTYNYAVNGTDLAGNSNQSAENSFTTADAPSVIISSPVNTTYNTSTISLNASFGGQNVSYAWYNVDNGANSTAQRNTTVLNASISISSDGAHNITVYANDSAGALGQSSVNFAVDTTGPVLSNVTSSSTTSNATRITWTTNENATSLVKYGTSSGNLDQNSANSSNVTSHSINLTGLVQNTTYYYVVNSTDEVGNSNQTSVAQQFTTVEVYGDVNGTITDANLLTAITNVTITLNASGGTYTATSDSNGQYNITNVITNITSPYVYTITASKTNYSPVSGTVTVIWSNVATKDLQMAMYDGTVRGNVIVSGTNIGVAGAELNFTNATLGYELATADASGAYSISLYPAIYTVTASKTGYLSSSTSETVVLNTTRTIPPISLSPNTVTITANRTVGSAEPGQNVSYNLTVVNTGENATFSVATSVTNDSTIVTNTTTPDPLILNTTISTGYVIVEVNNTNFGGWPVTITISNGSKSDSVILNAIMRNTSANYTNINSTVDANSTVTDATLVNATIGEGTNVSGNSTLIMDSNVTGANTVITDGAVIKGTFEDSNIDNSTIGNATVDSSNLTGSTVRDNASITNSTLTGAIVDNSTLTNVTVSSSSTITDVANLSDINLGGVIVTGDPNYAYEGTISGGTGWAEYMNMNFTIVYADIRISQLVIEQSPDENVSSGSIVSINDTGLGTSMNFSMTVNLTNPAVINISETGINPDGVGFSSGTKLGNFLVIRSNDTNASHVTSHILRLYFDTDPSTFTGGVAIYYYNVTASAWQKLVTTGSGIEDGRYYIEAAPNHFSTFALLGTTTVTPTTPGGSGGSTSNGGGVVTGEPFSNIAQYESYDKDLIANKSVTYTFKAPELAVYEIAVTGKDSEYGITLRVEALKGTSKQVTIQAPGTVFKNINIISGTKRMKEALIRFKVDNSWLGTNNLADSDIKMVKWDGSKWVQLETAVKTKDNTYTYFEAKTDTLSIFAISGTKGGAVTAAPTGGAVTTTQTGQVTETQATTAGTAVPTGKSPGFEVVSLIAGILAVAYILRKKN